MISQADLDGTLCIRDMESGSLRELDSGSVRVSYPRWSPDGRSLFAISWGKGKRFAYRIDVTSGKSTVIAEDLRLNYGSWPMWSWTLDGKSFYQTDGRGQTNLVRTEIETGRKTEISIPENSYTATLSPNGEQFAFSVIRWNRDPFSKTIHVIQSAVERHVCWWN